MQSAYPKAVATARVIDGLRSKVEFGESPRQTGDIDALNTAMEELAKLLEPLIPLKFPATAAAAAASGTPPVRVDDIVRLTAGSKLAVVTAIATPVIWDRRPPGRVLQSYPGPPIITLKYINPGNRLSDAPSIRVDEFSQKAIKRDSVETPRKAYLGEPKDKKSLFSKVKERMRQEKKVISAGGVEMVKYSRENDALYKVEDCDLGHIIDAVTWWNSNGRLTGAQSAEVKAFMNNAINYELEPGEQNQRRGSELAARGIRYKAPAK